MEFCQSEFVEPRIKIDHHDKGYAYVPKRRDFIEDPKEEFWGKSKFSVRSCSHDLLSFYYAPRGRDSSYFGLFPLQGPFGSISTLRGRFSYVFFSKELFGWIFLLILWLFYGFFDGLIRDYFRIVLCPVLWPDCGLFYGLNGDCFGALCGCFMACLWTVLWPNWGLFWDPFCGYIFFWFVGYFMGTILGPFSWLFHGLFVDYFMSCFMDGLWTVL